MTILQYELQRKNSHEGTYRLLSICQYDSDSTTGAVSANQHLRLHWQNTQEMVHGTLQPSTTPFPQKANDVAKQLAEPLAIFQNFPGQSSFSRIFLGSLGTKQIRDSTRPNTPRDSQETSVLPQRTQECHSTMVRSRLHRCTLARHDLRIYWCILCRHNQKSTFRSRILLLAQLRYYLLAREQNYSNRSECSKSRAVQSI